MSTLKLNVLGAAELSTADGRDVHAVLAQPKRLALLVYLAVAAPDGMLRRDTLVSVFWPEFDAVRARAALRDALYFLRRHLGQAIITRADEVGIDGRLLVVDAVAFQRAVRAEQHAQAVELYRGHLLEGLNVAAAPDFDDWLDRERNRLRELAADAARLAGETEVEGGAWRDAARCFRRALELAPFQETLLHRLMHALGQAGDHAGGIAAYEAFAASLARELGVAPSESTRALAEALRSPPLPPRYAAPPAGMPAAAAGTEPGAAGAELTAADTVGARAAGASRTGALSARAAGPPPAAAQGPGRTWLVLGALMVLAMATIWRTFGDVNGAPPLQPADLVVLPFTVHGSPAAGYLSEGMVDLFGAKLNGVGGVRSVDPQALMTVLATREQQPLDLASGRDIARRFNAGHFIMGTVVQAGSTLQVSAYLYNSDGVQLARADGADTDTLVIALVDDLARELLAGTFADAERLAGLAALTTASLPALRAYLDGERLFRAGAFEPAIAALQLATALDTTFALAYYRLSSAADWLGQAEVAEAAVRAALRHGDRLPASDRQLVRARHEYWFGDATRAEALYMQLTRARPNDVEAAFELGEVRFHAGPWAGRSFTAAESAFRDVLRLHPRHVAAMVHLARIAAATARPAMLDSIITAATAIEPLHSRNLELRALRAALRPGTDSLRTVVSDIVAYDNGSTATAVAERVAAFTGNLPAAEGIARAGLRDATGETREIALQSLSHLAVAQGNWAVATQLLAELAEHNAPLAAHVRANLITAPGVRATREEVMQAERALRALPDVEVPGVPAADPAHFISERRRYHLGVLAALRGDAAAAAEAARGLERAGTGDDAVFARGLAAALRARTLALAGDSAAALRTLESGWLPPRKPLMIGWAWTYSNVSTRMLRARLLLQQKRYDEAMQWADATIEDIAGTPLVRRDAKAVRDSAQQALQRVD